MPEVMLLPGPAPLAPVAPVESAPPAAAEVYRGVATVAPDPYAHLAADLQHIWATTDHPGIRTTAENFLGFGANRVTHDVVADARRFISLVLGAPEAPRPQQRNVAPDPERALSIQHTINCARAAGRLADVALLEDELRRYL